MQVPLQQAGKKLKAFKATKGKVSTKVKKNFDKTLPNETMGECNNLLKHSFDSIFIAMWV